MDRAKLDEVREYYDNTDLADHIETASYDDHTVSADKVMVGITVRFPKPALDRVREIADQQGMKVTALIRDIVERSIADEPQADRVIPVAVLQRLIAERSKPAA